MVGASMPKSRKRFIIWPPLINIRFKHRQSADQLLFEKECTQECCRVVDPHIRRLGKVVMLLNVFASTSTRFPAFSTLDTSFFSKL